MSNNNDTRYFLPVIRARGSESARRVGGNGPWFAEVEVLCRTAPNEILPIEAAEALWPDASEAVKNITRPKSLLAGVKTERPAIMGVVNVTPDSFSDGGQYDRKVAAIDHGLRLIEEGADVLDIGGESTRPGAVAVPESTELDRVIPVIEGLVAGGCPVPISIDTRKAKVAEAALSAGARLFNDVSAFTYQASSLAVAQNADAVCIMHALGDPRTMQEKPEYDDVVLDVYDFLAERVTAARSTGINHDQIAIDPGIGFGKTLEHNVSLLNHLSLFQALGCAVLLGVSRKGFIGRLSGVANAAQRAPGSIAAGLFGLEQGVQILRVHDVADTVQAVNVWCGLRRDEF